MKKQPKTKNHRKSGKRGYRLHDERIAYSGGGGSMRSIKYELQGADKQTVIDAVIHDNKHLYHDLNFNDYIGDDTPNLLEFWILALSLGFVFSTQNAIEPEFKKYLGIGTIYDELFNQLSDELKDIIKKDDFGAFVMTSNRGLKEKTAEQRKKLIYNLVRKLEKGEEKKAELLDEIAENWSNGLNDAEVNQQELKCEIFNIKMPEIDENAVSMSLGFAIDPNFKKIEYKTYTEFFDKIIAHFQQKGVEETQYKKFLAIGDNGNYFNVLFGGLFELLQSEISDDLINYLAKTYDFENKKDEIKNRLNELAEYAKKMDNQNLLKNGVIIAVILTEQLRVGIQIAKQNKKMRLINFLARSKKIKMTRLSLRMGLSNCLIKLKKNCRKIATQKKGFCRKQLILLGKIASEKLTEVLAMNWKVIWRHLRLI